MTRYIDRSIQWDAVLQSHDLAPSTQTHLGKVYGSLALAVLASVAGSRYALTYVFNQTLAVFLALGALIGFLILPHQRYQPNLLRQSLFVAFAFCEGLAVAPFLSAVLAIEGGMEVLALAGIATLAVFTALSLVAFFSQKRSYLYLGGMLVTGLNVLLISSLANFFFRSPLIFDVQLYLGLIVFAGYVVFDTQLIIAKAECGDDDHLAHAVELFLDLLNLFVRIAALLSKNKKKRDD